MLKRIFDIILSTGSIIVLTPVFITIWIAIKLESKGSAIFKQKRVGLLNKDFTLYKFRTMFVNAEQKGQLTIGMRDPRITKVGYVLRKFKLDELPQLFNVLAGNMSLVGPRPEVRRYVEMYSAEQLKVLSVKPGITDYASLKFFNENKILGKSNQPEADYIQIIMPEKLKLNLDYVNNSSILIDLKIIFATLFRIFYH